MDIHQDSIGDPAHFTMSGRLDALTAGALREHLAAAMETGARHLELDLAAVDFMSSAAIRVLLQFHVLLGRIKGSLVVVAASPFVRELLEIAGLYDLLVREEMAPPTPAAVAFQVPEMRLIGSLNPLEPGARLRMTQVPQGGGRYPFPATSFSLGFGTLCLSEHPAVATDCGTLVAAGGYAIYACPAAGYIPDYMIHAPEFVSRLDLLQGWHCTGDFAFFLDFAGTGREGVGLDALGRYLLDATEEDALGLILVGEAGTVAGERLRPDPAGGNTPLAEPRSLGESALLVAGWVGRKGGAGQVGACHAAAFQPAPLRKGPQRLTDAVTALFNQPLVEVLHLLPATRLKRGVAWLAPLDQDG